MPPNAAFRAVSQRTVLSRIFQRNYTMEQPQQQIKKTVRSPSGRPSSRPEHPFAHLDFIIPARRFLLILPGVFPFPIREGISFFRYEKAPPKKRRDHKLCQIDSDISLRQNRLIIPLVRRLVPHLSSASGPQVIYRTARGRSRHVPETCPAILSAGDRNHVSLLRHWFVFRHFALSFAIITGLAL